ncbi:MAG: glycosyltransferase family 2 protein [Melioribacteraceae bacterium]|nr:glycosyltransferase family 2 protein [Melioribacteraceae bacterium]
MEKKIKLSSIIIARDEERNIERCIASQIGIIDDIVLIVDSRTIDSTVEIAKKFSEVNVEIAEWSGFSSAKTLALEKTKYEWVFWIDADEELTELLKKEVEDFKDSAPQFDIYDVPRKAYFLGKWIKHCGWYPGRVPRLFNKSKISFNQKSVHEGLTGYNKVGHFKYDLNHYTDPNIEHYINKMNHYTTLAAKDIITQDKPVGLVDLIIRPLFIFIKMYILRLGFLDGFHGLVLSLFSAHYVFIKYSKVWELKK